MNNLVIMFHVSIILKFFFAKFDNCSYSANFIYTVISPCYFSETQTTESGTNNIKRLLWV